MVNPSGSVTISGITDTELAEILEIKAKSDGTAVNFNPQQLSPIGQGTKNNYYQNAVFNWQGLAGLKIVQEIITMLLNVGSKAQVQAQ